MTGSRAVTLGQKYSVGAINRIWGLYSCDTEVRDPVAREKGSGKLQRSTDPTTGNHRPDSTATS